MSRASGATVCCAFLARARSPARQAWTNSTISSGAKPATIQKERAALEELRAKLRESETEVKQAMAQAGTLKGDLDQVRAIIAPGLVVADLARFVEVAKDPADAVTRIARAVSPRPGT